VIHSLDFSSSMNKHYNQMKKGILFVLIGFACTLKAQEPVHEAQIKTLYHQALTAGKSYDWLDHLSNKIGGRLSGSLNAERAVEWGKKRTGIPRFRQSLPPKRNGS